MVLRTSCLFSILTCARFPWLVSCGCCCWTLICCHFLSLSSCRRIIFLPIIVCVKELLKPLHKLKVVLELALHKLVNWNNLQRDGRCFKIHMNNFVQQNGKHYQCANKCNQLTYFADTHLFEAGLKKFEVVDVFMLKFGLEFDFLQWDA